MLNNTSSNDKIAVLRHLNAFCTCIYTLELKSQLLKLWSIFPNQYVFGKEMFPIVLCTCAEQCTGNMPQYLKPDSLSALLNYADLYFYRQIYLILLRPWSNEGKGVIILCNSSLGSGPLLSEELQHLHLQGASLTLLKDTLLHKHSGMMLNLVEKS